MNVVVDPEFERLLPPLSDETAKGLEGEIVAAGRVRIPIEVWNNGQDLVVLDGHNRKKFAEKHGLPYQTLEIELPDRDAAKDYIDRQQISRRNLSQPQIEIVRGRVYERRKMSKAQAGAKGGASKAQNELCLSNTTAEQVGSEFGVDKSTIKRSHKFYKAVEGLRPIVPDIDSIIAEKRFKSRLAVVKASKDAKSREEAIAIMNTTGLSERTRTERRKKNDTRKPYRRNPGKAFDVRLEGILSLIETNMMHLEDIADRKIDEESPHFAMLRSTLTLAVNTCKRVWNACGDGTKLNGKVEER